MKLFNLSKESVFITGASGFLGLQYSEFLCQQGARVYGVDLNENKKILTLQKNIKIFIFINAM